MLSGGALLSVALCPRLPHIPRFTVHPPENPSVYRKILRFTGKNTSSIGAAAATVVVAGANVRYGASKNYGNSGHVTARARLRLARAGKPSAGAILLAGAIAGIAAAATIDAAATGPDFSDGNLGPDSTDDNLGVMVR